jgi:hypothetical protein
MSTTTERTIPWLLRFERLALRHDREVHGSGVAEIDARAAGLA